MGPILLMPALLTSTSSRPNSATAASARRWRSSRRVTSVARLMARPPLVADLLRELVQALGPARAQDDGRAPPGEQPRGGLADAAARAGDGDDLAADAGHRDLPSGKVDMCPLSSETTGHVSA